MWNIFNNQGITISVIMLPLTRLCLCIEFTGGPPLTQKSLTRFPLPLFLAYVRVSRRIRASTASTLTRISSNMFFSKS